MKNSKYLKMFDPELAQKLMLEGKNQEEIGKIMGGVFLSKEYRICSNTLELSLSVDLFLLMIPTLMKQIQKIRHTHQAF